MILTSYKWMQGLTLKIGNVKRMTPASRAGLCKMDYLISVSTYIVDFTIMPSSFYRN